MESDISALLSSFCDKLYINIIVQLVQKAENMAQICFKGHGSMDTVG